MDSLERLAAALADRYRIERELGRGGMAVVLLAEDLKHGRRVAIKLLKPELTAVLGSGRFLREIAIAAALQHPHILPLYDSGEADGQLYYVMPFVDGESLGQRLAREPQLPIDLALQITREVGSALRYAHEHGIIHRDIKPDNIMLSGGHAVVTDFGIARALHAAGAAEQLTGTGMVIGTPLYMSPEQASGTTVDARSDQYSLACTLYEMLIGQPPFSGASPLVLLARHSLDPVPSLRLIRGTIPPSVEGAIMRAMAKLPADRFGTVQEFLQAIAAPEAAETSADRAPVPKRRFVFPMRRRALVALGACGLVAAGWWVVIGRRQPTVRSTAGRIAAVAVLPFQDLSSNPDSSFLGDGMTEGLISDLAQIGSLKVISRASGAVAQGTARSLADMARTMGVGAVVRGSIQKSGDTVRVRLQFLQAPDSVLLFAREYQVRLGQLPDLQRQITADITESIGAGVKGTERAQVDRRREVDQRAYEAYLRGRFHLERGELEQARSLFEQSSRMAPEWAPPYVGLANYYTSLPFSTDTPPAEVLPRARAALARALELDESLAEAHAAIAYIRAYYEWDWRAAEQEFRRALELSPSYADAYFSYSRFLASRGRLDEAMAQLGRAVELDPLSPSLLVNRALLEYFAGRYDDSERELRVILKSDSTDLLARWALALVAEQQGRADEAITILQPISSGTINRKSSLAHALAIDGRSREARAQLAELRTTATRSYVPAYFFAVVYAGLGERDQALHFLERAYDERSTVLAYLLIDPRLATLRDEPRFLALARRLRGE